jgi:hypothetical protein
VPGGVLALPLALFVGLTVAGIFLASHQADLVIAAEGGAMAAWLRHGRLFTLRDFAASAAGAGIALLLVLAWVGIGRLLTRRGPGHGGSASALALGRDCAFGAGVWSLLWFGLGLAGLYVTWLAVGLLLVGVALGVMTLGPLAPVSRDGSDRPPAPVSRDGSGGPLAVTAGVLLVLATVPPFIGALAPPTAKDTLQYHIALPKAYAAAAGLVDVPYNIASFFPAGAEMTGLSAMLAGRALGMRVGEAAFGATLFMFLPVLLVVIYGWARQQGLDRAWSVLAAALVVTVPTVAEEAASAYVDVALALYLALAIEAAARWWTSLDRSALAHMGLALGFALGVKVLSGFGFLFVGLLVLLRARTAARASAVLGPLAALGVALALAAPWYVRTWVRTGSPVFPFFAGLWKGTAVGWDEDRSVMFQAFSATWGGNPEGPLDYLLTPLRLAFGGDRHLPAHYEGVLGPAFLLGTAMIVVALWRRRLAAPSVVAATAGAALFLWWLVSAQVLRYLLPALPPLAVATAAAGAAGAAAAGRAMGWSLLVVAAVSQAISLAWFVQDNPAGVVLGGESRSAYLDRRLDYYPYYRMINSDLSRDSRVWLIDMRRDTYHLERDFFGDYLFEDYTLQRFVAQARSPADLAASARTLGITHVLARHDLLLDQARSPFVDDRQPEAVNRARLALVQAFLAGGGRVLKADGKFVLSALGP